MRDTPGVRALAFMAFALGLLIAPLAHAQTLTVLYTFTGGADGGTPLAAPILYNGSLYGTTSGGGTQAAGTIYALNFQSRHQAVLHSFAGYPTDGAAPFGGLIQDSSGNFYGTTNSGGANNRGAVFKLTLPGKVVLLHSFAGPPSEGYDPAGQLVFDPAGDLFGTTQFGGNSKGWGTTFEISAGGVYTTGMNFPPDGALPHAGLYYESGHLYGTTTGGIIGTTDFAGTVFEVGVTPARYEFTGGADGAEPLGGVIGDGQGNLYGTASAGGSANLGLGSGVVFKVNIATGKETVLHTFKGPDGSTPEAGLTVDTSGNFYGTTSLGGAYGYGTVFKLDTAGNFTTIYSFTGGSDGATPRCGVLVDAAGNIWGATSAGGSAHAPGGFGTLFIIPPPAT